MVSCCSSFTQMADGDNAGAMLCGAGKGLCAPPASSHAVDELFNAPILHFAVIWCARCLHVLPVATSTVAKPGS